MPPDWNAVRLDLLQIDAPMRAMLGEMRPFFANSLPGILARFYDKVRHYDPSSDIFRDGAMQEVIRMQLQHWDLIAACDFGQAYTSSVARLCEFNQRAGVAPQWYIGCRLMFIAEQLMKAAEDQVQIPRWGRAAQAARTRCGTLHQRSSRPDREQPLAAAPHGSIARDLEALHRFAGFVAIRGAIAPVSRRSGPPCASS